MPANRKERKMWKQYWQSWFSLDSPVPSYNKSKSIQRFVINGVANSVKERKNPTIVDVGAGIGFLTKKVKEELENQKLDPKIYAVDISPLPLTELPEDIIPKLASADNLDFLKDNSIDCYFSVFTMRYIKPKDSMVKEMRRVLKPGAKAVLVLWAKDSIFLDRLEDGLNASKLEIKRLETALHIIAEEEKPTHFNNLCKKLEKEDENDLKSFADHWTNPEKEKEMEKGEVKNKLKEMLNETEAMLERYSSFLNPENSFSSKKEVKDFFKSNSFSVEKIVPLKPSDEKKKEAIFGYGAIVQNPK